MIYVEELTLENFMCFESQTINVSRGLNVLIGETDNGKSALITALKLIFQNDPSGDEYITFGQKDCRVTVKLSNGYIVQRERTPSLNRYNYWTPEGEEYNLEGFGQTVPDTIKGILGIYDLYLDNDLKVELYFEGQFDGFFGLSEVGDAKATKSVKAKAVGVIYGVHYLDSAYRDTQREERQTGDKIRDTELEVKELNEKLEGFEYLDELGTTLKEGETLIEKIQELLKRREALSDLRIQYLKVCEDIRREKDIINQLSVLKYLEEDLDNAEQLMVKRLDLAMLYENYLVVKKEIGECKQIVSAVECLPIAGDALDCSEKQLNNIKELIREKVELVCVKKKIAACIQIIGAVGNYEETLKMLAEAERKMKLRDLYIEFMVAKGRIEENRNIVLKTEDCEIISDLLEIVQGELQKRIDVTGLGEERKETIKTINGIRETITQTQQLPDAEAKLTKLEALLKRKEELLRLNGERTKEIQKIIEQKAVIEENELALEAYLESYKEHLQKMGKCPTCFGNMEQAVIDRIIDEYKCA